MLSVLVVDDEKNIRTTLGMCLEGEGCAVTADAGALSAVACARMPRSTAAIVVTRATRSIGGRAWTD